MAPSSWAAPRTALTDVFVSYEQGRRNRRTSDGVLLATMVVLTGAAAAIANGAPAKDADLGEAIVTVLGWAHAVWRTIVVAAILLCAVLLVAAVVRRRWAVGRDALLALGLLALMGGTLGRVVGPGLVRRRRQSLVQVGLPRVQARGRGHGRHDRGSRADRSAAPPAGLAARAVRPVAAGSGGRTSVRLPAAMSPWVRPQRCSCASVRLGGRNISSPGKAPASSASSRRAGRALTVRCTAGARQYVGHDMDGRPVHLRILGRDAQDTQKIARRWRLMAYRDPPRSAPIGRLEQVEHEALATVLAAQAGVRVPEVVLAALGSDGHAGIVTRRVEVEPLEAMPSTAISDDLPAMLWRDVSTHTQLNQ